MTFRQEILDAAVSLWTKIIPKGIMITKYDACARYRTWATNYVCHCENITNFARWIRTLATHWTIGARYSIFILHKYKYVND